MPKVNRSIARETIFRSNDPEAKVLSIEDVAALSKGDSLVWISDGERVEGPLGETPGLRFNVEDDVVTAYAFFSIELSGEHYWTEFIESYPMGKDSDGSAEALMSRLSSIQRG